MNIREMAVMFRELGQQMGMQTNRAILDEDICICINAAIIDKVREVLTENLGPINYADKVIRQNTVITPVNAIRTLYCRGTIVADDIQTDAENGEANEVYPWYINIDSNNANKSTDNPHRVMLYTGFKITYNKRSLYDCRIIEAEDLGQTLRDFCNRAAPDAPIAVVLGDKDSISVDIYTGRTTNTWKLQNSFRKPALIQFLYIKEPQMVYLGIDGEGDVDCDLPAYLHSELVERAIGKYLVSIGATSGTNSQQKNNQ